MLAIKSNYYGFDCGESIRGYRRQGNSFTLPLFYRSGLDYHYKVVKVELRGVLSTYFKEVEVRHYDNTKIFNIKWSWMMPDVTPSNNLSTVVCFNYSLDEMLIELWDDETLYMHVAHYAIRKLWNHELEECLATSPYAVDPHPEDKK